MSWAAEELKQASLGDARRNRRLITLVEDLAGSPEESIPQASRDAAAVQAAYWDYLKRCGFTLKLPRPRHAKAEAEQQEAFKKN